MLVNLTPNDPTVNSLYPSVLWDNVVNLDIPTSYKTVQYIASPQPSLMITFDPTQELNPQPITVTLSGYDTINYPTIFEGFTVKSIPFNLPFKVCLPGEPYLIVSLQDCVAACPTGYTADANQNCIMDMNINLQSLTKLPASNRI